MLKAGVITCAIKAIDAFSSRRFCLKRSVFQPCLVYPMDEWNLMMQKINKLNRFVKKNDFIRRFTAGVKWLN
jgi:MraZ protein